MPPRRSGRKRWPIAVALIVALLVAGVPASQYTTGVIDRGAGISVADDPNAVLELEGATELQDNGGTKKDDLVNLTNRFDSPIDVTVTLLNNTDNFDVCTPSRCSGDSITVTGILSGNSQLFEVDGSGGGNTIQYEIVATTDSGVKATVVRTAGKAGNGNNGNN